MRTARGKKLLWIFAAVLAYLLLLKLLVLAESGAEGASIRSLSLAFWYSITTLTTVGYGDIYPVTKLGRILGMVFELMSLGVLAAVFSLILQLVQGKLLPRIKLFFSRKKTWYVFPEAEESSLILAKKLIKEKDALIVLPTAVRKTADASRRAVFTDMDASILCRMHPALENVHVFFLGKDEFANEKQAFPLKELGCRVYYLSENEPTVIPRQISVFHPAEASARLYWHRFPVQSPNEKIVLVGGGVYGRALLEQGLLVNVVSPEQQLHYTLCGDGWDEFFREHPYLSQFIDREPEKTGRDCLSYNPGPWNQDWKLFEEPDRIVFCEEEEALNASEAASLLRFCPVKGLVYARLSQTADGVIGYGSPEELNTPELIMRRALNSLAIRLHEKYCESAGRKMPSWNELGSFLRRSNLASADHLFMKARILLGEEAGQIIDWKKAAACYRDLSDAGKERCRRIEHERWNRFHLLNNWNYGPVRDNQARIHPLIKPFDALSAEDQAKDDYAWELLDQAAEIRPEE
ncbi:MAG: hypothetical protein J5496_02640 [Lachnospiraceae bacterium]|nr:hypothetical protein [Lachnospiraceae bacterium]